MLDDMDSSQKFWLAVYVILAIIGFLVFTTAIRWFTESR